MENRLNKIIKEVKELREENIQLKQKIFKEKEITRKAEEQKERFKE